MIGLALVKRIRTRSRFTVSDDGKYRRLREFERRIALAVPIERTRGHLVAPRGHEDPGTGRRSGGISEDESIRVRAVVTSGVGLIERRSPISGRDEQSARGAPEARVLDEELTVARASPFTHVHERARWALHPVGPPGPTAAPGLLPDGWHSH